MFFFFPASTRKIAFYQNISFVLSGCTFKKKPSLEFISFAGGFSKLMEIFYPKSHLVFKKLTCMIELTRFTAFVEKVEK
jgi:hypothetical protein